MVISRLRLLVQVRTPCMEYVMCFSLYRLSAISHNDTA